MAKTLLFFDTETTGLCTDWKISPKKNPDNWPRLVQLAYIQTDGSGKILKEGNFIIKPDGFEVPQSASDVHGITTDIATQQGQDIALVLNFFEQIVAESDAVIGHNISFDNNVILGEYYRNGIETSLDKVRPPKYCTMKGSLGYCKILNKNKKGYKYPKLSELHEKLFGVNFENAHDARSDVAATKKCFFQLIMEGISFKKIY